MSTLIETIKDYTSGLDVGETNFGEKEVIDIKSDYSDLASAYVRFFSDFSRLCKECKNKEVIAMLGDDAIFKELVKLSSYKTRTYEFGKSRSIQKLCNYVYENYLAISNFFDLWMDVIEG